MLLFMLKYHIYAVHTTQSISVWFLYGGHLRLPHVVLHTIKQSTIFTCWITVYWFRILVHASIIFVVVTLVFSHKKPRIFCFPSAMTCLFTWSKQILHILIFLLLKMLKYECYTIIATTVWEKKIINCYSYDKQ